MLKAVLESIGVTSGQQETMQIEKTVVGLAWTSSSFLTQECGLCVHAVRSLRAYQHPPPVHERRKREVIQFASGPHKPHMQLHGLPSSRFLRHSHSACHGRPPCFLSASGETPSLHFVLQNVWPDPGNGAHLRKTKLHPPTSCLSLPACRAGGRGTGGLWAEPRVPAASNKTGVISGGWWAARGRGDSVEGSTPASWHVDGRAVSKDRRLHLASWLAQQFLQEV